MKSIVLGLVGIIASSVAADAAITLFKGPVTISAATGCTSGWNPAKQTFTGSYSIGGPAKTGVLRFSSGYRAVAFASASTGYTNTTKTVTASRQYLPLDEFSATAKITQPAPASINSSMNSVKLYGRIQGWDGIPACVVDFRMDLVRVAEAPQDWLPVDGINRPADFYVDRINGRFFGNGTEYLTLPELQAGLGATVVGPQDWTFPWTASSSAAMVEAYGGSSGGVNQVLVQLDNGASSNRLAIRKGASSNLGVQAVVNGTTWMSQDTHTVVVAQTFRIAASFGKNAGVVSQDGEATKTDTSVNLPVVTTFRIGSGPSSASPSRDVIWKVAAWKSPLAAADVRTLANLHPIAWGEGDSYTGGSGGVSTMGTLARLSSRAVSNKGIGGSTLASQVTRVASEVAAFPGVPFIHWDGDPNGYNANLAVDMANYAKIVGSLGHSKFVIIAPLPRAGQTAAQRQRARDLTAALLAAYPGHIVDALPILISMAGPTDAADVAANVCPSSLLQDGVHLKQPAMDAVIANGVMPILPQ